MEIKVLIILICLGLHSVIISVYGERAKDKMYQQIKGAASCFRRMNGTHQTGCSSKRPSSTGVIHFMENLEELNYILQNGTAGPYIAVAPLQFLTSSIAKLIKENEKIAGLILYKDQSNLQHYSHEQVCPNSNFNAPNTCSKDWNAKGTGLLLEDFPIPIFYVQSEEEVTYLKQCFQKFNNFSYETQSARSLCSLELQAFMFATTNTPTCIRRSNSKTNLNPIKICDPLGDQNVWSTLFPLENGTKGDSKKYVVVLSRTDTTSFFHEIAPGAVNPLTGLVTLLATADLLKQILPSNMTHEKNVLFLLLSGETYDYIGSQRVVYDMGRNQFPTKNQEGTENPIPTISLDDISLLIELNQLNSRDSVFVHSSSNKSEIGNFVNQLKKNSKITVSHDSTGAIPPASLQTFLRSQKDVAGLILTDHKDSYRNKYYNSIYDDSANIDYHYYNLTEGDETIPDSSIQRYVANISEMLAFSIYNEVTGKDYKGQEKARINLVDELFNCYLLNMDCKVHQAIQKRKIRDPQNFYVSVSASTNLITVLLGLTLGWLTGDRVDNTSCKYDPQQSMYRYFNMSASLDDLNKTVCYRTIMNFTEAVSPAFIIENYNWKSGEYSSWTESVWKDFNVRMYLKPSAAHETMTIATGSTIFILSMIIVYFVKSRSHILFVTVIDSPPTSC